MEWERFVIKVQRGEILAWPSFTAPEKKYPASLRPFLGIEIWIPGVYPRCKTKGFQVPRVGVILKVSEEKTRTLWLFCGNDFIDSALSNLPKRQLYGQEILDCFLSSEYREWAQ